MVSLRLAAIAIGAAVTAGSGAMFLSSHFLDDELALTVRDNAGDVVLTGAVTREGNNVDVRMFAPGSSRMRDALRQTEIPKIPRH